MYVVAVIEGLLFLLLIILSRNREDDLVRKGIWSVLDKVSLYLYDAYIRISSRFTGKRWARKTSGRNIDGLLEQLRPGESVGCLRKNYIVKKISMSILIILLGTAIGVIVKYTAYRDAVVVDSDGNIKREDFTGSSRELSVTAMTDDYSSTVSFTLQPRMLSDQEVQELLPEFHEKLGLALMAENESLERITTKLNPVVRLEGYPFSIRWSTSDYSLISPSEGKVAQVEEKCQVFMTAYVKYGNSSWEEEYALIIVPKEYSDIEAIEQNLEREVIYTEEKMRESEYMTLPREYDGKTVTWKSTINDNSIFVWVVVLVIAVVVFFVADKDLEKKVFEKKKRMKGAYSEIARKFALYVGAGMTVRSSFLKIASDAVGKSNDNPIYQEMIYAVRELKSGVSEEEAYERFGRRTGVQEYIRMSTLLQQNIKRGSGNLLGRLREEAENASLERLQACRKRGEEASTKLLLPMVMMLVVVMVMVMFPAFSSMNL